MKKTGFAIVYLLAIILMIEGTGHLAYRISQGKWFDLSEIKAERQGIIERYAQRDKQVAAEFAEGVDRSGGWKIEIVHPYIGYVIDYNDNACGTLGYCSERMQRYIVEYPDRHFVPNNEENLIIAITGGSFANGVASGSSPDKWETELAKIPEFRAKKIYVYSFASGGVKQPQQLNSISFFIGMGASFDAIVNIDGFNEIALGLTENAPRGVSPDFPRYWNRRVGLSKVDPAIGRLEGEHAFFQEQQRDQIKRFEKRWYRNTALGNLLWIITNNRAVQRIAAAEQKAQAYQPDPKKILARLEATGPHFKRKEQGDTLTYSASFWARSSRSLQGIADAHGIPYFHFLQPNQYVEGSKPMNAEERAIALKPDYPYGEAAIAGYPLLIESGKQLKQDGVNFFDLTDVFADKNEVLYRDACCHVNQQGYDYVVDEITEVIGQHFKAR